MALAARLTWLNRDETGHANVAPADRDLWWRQKRPWPPGMHFEDVSLAELAFERLADTAPLGPPPAPPGTIGCTAALCEMSRFAEPEVEAVSH
jgi:hypothetical protein